VSDRRALSDKRRRLRGGSVRKRGSIGQNEKVERRKCPKEGLYWTKGVKEEKEMSDRPLLLDKTVEDKKCPIKKNQGKKHSLILKRFFHRIPNKNGYSDFFANR
jgi:hypothetical protein